MNNLNINAKKILLFAIEWCKLPKSYVIQKDTIIIKKKSVKKKKAKQNNDKNEGSWLSSTTGRSGSWLKTNKKLVQDSDSDTDTDTESDSSDDHESSDNDTNSSSNTDDDEKDDKTIAKYSELIDFKDKDEMKWETIEISSKKMFKNHYKYTINELHSNKAYAIQIRCKNRSGWSMYSVPIRIETPKVEQTFNKKFKTKNIRVVNKKLIKDPRTSVSSIYEYIFFKAVNASGKHHWRFKFKQYPGWCCIGLYGNDKEARDYVNGPSSSYIGTKGSDCYVFHTSQARLNIHGQRNGWTPMNSYGIKVKQSDVVDMYLDYNKKSLSYGVNKQKFGKAFTIRKKKYRAFINTYNSSGSNYAEIELVKYSHS